MSLDKKEIEASVKKMVADFQERHVGTSVRVFVSYTENAKSAAFSWGGGDWYAQYGHAEEWVETQRERSRLMARETERKDEEGAF